MSAILHGQVNKTRLTKGNI